MYRKFFKRAIDLGAGIVLFWALLPVMIVIAVVLRITCGKVFFVQERVGYGCRKFKIVKFCTMTNACNDKGDLLPDEERKTAVGDFLRRISLDELPQLLNIIKGDMSFVGPRPLIECQVAGCTKQELRRYWVKPGLTGLAQINGRNAVSFKNRFRYDVWYVKNYSFGVDWLIVYHTARMVLGLDKDRNVIYDPTVAGK